MKSRVQNPPHIRSRECNRTIMMDTIIAMLFLYAMATYFYGKRALALGMFSAAICVLADLLCVLLAKKIPNMHDMSPVVTGLMIPLLMPASISWEIVAAAALFAILVVKHPFGGLGQNVFNPAVSGVAFAIICWPTEIFAYPNPFSQLPLDISEGVKIVASSARTLMLNGVPTTNLSDMLLGIVPGAMGATNILVLITCLLYLTVRKIISLPMTCAFLGTAAIFAAMFPRAMMTPLNSIAYELMSGTMIIGAVFLINDPVTSPKGYWPKILYGAIAGFVSMLFRHLGNFEESILFAILIMNASAWIIDLWGEEIAHKIRRRKHENNKLKEIQEDDAEDIVNS